ncbi:MAG TPA: hypothetical protein VFX49_15400 [Chloroflexota bacterium]|nr:hypothetical protein [Chloroflexota bacterium]
MVAADPHVSSSRIHLSSGATLNTRLRPEEWATLFARAASTKHEGDTHWVPLDDGRTVLIQLRHVAYVEPAPDWKPKRGPGMSAKSKRTEQTFGPDYSPE